MASYAWEYPISVKNAGAKNKSSIQYGGHALEYPIFDTKKRYRRAQTINHYSRLIYA